MPAIKQLKMALRRSETLFRVLHPIHKAYRVGLMKAAQRRMGINPRKVVFSSFKGRSYSDNPRDISEKLHEMCPECEIVWLFDAACADRIRTPDYVKRETLISRQGLIEQATARFWVDNFKRTETIYLNDREQFYINTWHGDRGFKKVGDDNEKLPRAVLRLEDRCSMMIAGSEFGARTYRTAFHYKGEILMDGCPRNDILIKNDPAQAAQIRRRLNVGEGTGLLIYAPTYRDDRENQRQDATLDVSATLDHLEESTGRRWLCLYRAHYINAGLNVRADARVRDVSGWEQMSELLLVSDMLITDYSSCGGDFALLRRPLFLYQPDREEYLRNSRSFYFDIEKSPFLVARSRAELETLIDATDADKARENCEALDRFFGTTETGHAAEAVCRYIMDRMDD